MLVLISETGQQEACSDEGAKRGNEKNRRALERGAGVGAIPRFR